MASSNLLFLVNCFCFALAVLAIELTLTWNSVSGISSMNSVGQLIPFMVGVGGLAQVIWAIMAISVSLLRK
jgi:hypothetical protein